MDAKISIVVPIYKVEKYLNRCIESIINQTYKNLEIILIDDGSPDKCPQICDDWAQRDERIVVIHKINGGLSDARNAGINIAAGEYLLFVDSDDYIELDACERLYKTMLETNADFVVSSLREINGNIIRYQRRSTLKSDFCYCSSEFIVESINANEWYAPAVLNLYKVKFLNENGLRFKTGIIYEDMELLPRLYLAADKISYCDYVFYNYEIRDDSIMTSKVNQKKIDNIVGIYLEWKQLFDSLKNITVKEKLYGALIKHYLYSCRVLGITSWIVEGIDYQFSVKYALNLKEKIKCVLFDFFPDLYIRIADR